MLCVEHLARRGPTPQCLPLSLQGSRQLCSSVMHKKGPSTLRAQITWRVLVVPATSTLKASIRFAAFLCEISASFLSQLNQRVMRKPSHGPW